MAHLRKIGRILLPLFILPLFIFGCPIYELFGITCPCCGVTRAWLAFLRGDVLLAFQYHLFFPLIPAFLIFYGLDRLTKKTEILFITVAVALFLYNAMRWFGLVNMP